jgi:dihydrofolate reductase
MTRVIADISMSLDGFVTGPDPGPEQGLGAGGEALHTWAMDSDDPVDTAVLREGTDASGAVIMGRRLFDIIDAPDGWNDEMGYGAAEVGTPPFFVVTHRPPEHVRLDLDFTFVTDGLESAVAQARDRAGDRDVVIMGGGDVIAQCVAGRLLDELRIHLSPVVLGGGTPLFPPGERCELVQEEVRPSSTATHLTYTFPT